MTLQKRFVDARAQFDKRVEASSRLRLFSVGPNALFLTVAGFALSFPLSAFFPVRSTRTVLAASFSSLLLLLLHLLFLLLLPFALCSPHCSAAVCRDGKRTEREASPIGGNFLSHSQSVLHCLYTSEQTASHWSSHFSLLSTES